MGEREEGFRDGAETMLSICVEHVKVTVDLWAAEEAIHAAKGNDPIAQMAMRAARFRRQMAEEIVAALDNLPLTQGGEHAG